ncbi:MAG: formate dehydrogenase subunit gamma [Gammaproteobacteria bacterium]|nr:MAG: formate dehydrogenase subunit gamma [Gammaproteobacteria bacterium]
MSNNKQSRIRHHRMVVFSLLSLVVLTLVLPLIPYAIAELGETAGNVANPGTEYWRDVRQRDRIVTGTTQVRGVDTDVLINVTGEEWRQFRMGQLAPYGAIVLGVMVGILVVYYLVRGKIRIEAGRSGERVRRYTSAEMTVHWILAITFVLLALSGLILIYGRWVLIPLLGDAGFSATATASKVIHNYGGLLFAAIVPVAFFLYLKDSLFNLKVDAKWFLRAGGYLGGEEPSAEKVNAGQKAWYWVAMLGGFVLVASGLVLDFPNIFQQGREWLQGAHVIHTIVAIGVIVFFFVHLYLATIGVEGALESITSGHVDANWAKQHHDLWYKELQTGQGGGSASEEPSMSGGSHAGGVASPIAKD